MDRNRFVIFVCFFITIIWDFQFRDQCSTSIQAYHGICDQFYEYIAIPFIYYRIFMQDQFPEVIVVIIAGAFLALLLVGFVVTMLVVYRRKQFLHEQEL